MNVVVLAGGLSPERDVSLSSGCKIANALIENGHKVLLADLYMGLPDARDFGGAYAKYKKEHYEYRVPEREPDLMEISRMREDGGSGIDAGQMIGEGILPICADADITFNALHGSIGENGRLQAVLDVFGIKYTGTGYEGSLLAMNKPLAKELMRLNGINTPEWKIIGSCDGAGAVIPDGIGFPCVIKPCGCGSSIGVSIVNTPVEFAAAIKYAREYEETIMVEPKISGREFSIGVLGGEALPPIEIIPRSGFYDYKNKYQQDATLEVCPPDNLTPSADAMLRDAALKTHNILKLGGYSRLDAILASDGNLFCLETNTLPGMTPTSLLPQEAAAAGISFRDLCEKIILLALKRT